MDANNTNFSNAEQKLGAKDKEPQFAPLDPFQKPVSARLPSFPTNSLPVVLRDMAQAVALSLQVAEDMVAVALLTVVALCLQGKFVIKPKPDWMEQLCLYSIIVARPSEKKSPVLALVEKPLLDYEAAENDRRRPLIERQQLERDILTKKLAHCKEQLSKSTSESISLDNITDIQGQLRELEESSLKPLRLLADDTTSEALIRVMEGNGDKIAILSDEGGILENIAGRYSQGKANLDIYLKAYSGSYLRVDRQTRPSIVMTRPLLTMLLMLQPTVLDAIMENPDFSGRGFLARLLYCIPPSMVGTRQYDTPPIPLTVKEAYNQLITELLSIPDPEEAHIISISPEAHQEAKHFFDILEPRLLEDLGDLDRLEGWTGKYHGQVMRIAAILHCCENGGASDQVVLEASTMLRAQEVGEYFLAHAQAAFQMMGLTDDTATKNAKYIWKRLETCEENQIDKHALLKLCSKLSAEEMAGSLNILSQRGYISIETVRTGKAGKPPQIIHINPVARGK